MRARAAACREPDEHPQRAPTRREPPGSVRQSRSTTTHVGVLWGQPVSRTDAATNGVPSARCTHGYGSAANGRARHAPQPPEELVNSAANVKSCPRPETLPSPTEEAATHGRSGLRTVGVPRNRLHRSRSITRNTRRTVAPVRPRARTRTHFARGVVADPERGSHPSRPAGPGVRLGRAHHRHGRATKKHSGAQATRRRPHSGTRPRHRPSRCRSSTAPPRRFAPAVNVPCLPHRP